MSNQSTDAEIARYAESFGGKARGVAESLRDLADRVDRIAKHGPYKNLRTLEEGTHVSVAQEIVHEVTWGFANLNLSTLIQRAADTDSNIAFTRAEETD